MAISLWYKWTLFNDKSNGLRIRRYRKVGSKVKWENYPKEKCEGYDKAQLESLVRRLNASRAIEEVEAAKRYEFDTAYINKRTLEQFESHLKLRADSERHVGDLLSALKTHTLNFFINKQKIPDPNKWLQYETGFGSYLVKTGASVSHLKRIMQVTNRFLKFLHRSNPMEISLVVLDPLSGIKLRGIAASSAGSIREKYIPEAHCKAILKVDKAILPAVLLGLNFGLRISEVLGLEVRDVFEDCLDIKRQLLNITPVRRTGPLKNRSDRSCPFWFASPQQAYEWIDGLPVMHPTTLSRAFKVEMLRLKLPYQFHDLRRTFITNALRVQNPRDVQLAVGHSDLRTTMQYAQDDRQLQRKQFNPSKLKSV